jgi:hypothetical protein
MLHTAHFVLHCLKGVSKTEHLQKQAFHFLNAPKNNSLKKKLKQLFMLGKALDEAVSHGLTRIEPAQLHLT